MIGNLHKTSWYYANIRRGLFGRVNVRLIEITHYNTLRVGRRRVPNKLDGTVQKRIGRSDPQNGFS